MHESWSKSHIGSYEMIDFKEFKALQLYNQPRIVSTQIKLTYTKCRPFPVFESLPSTSCCSQKFLLNNLAGWTCKVVTTMFSLGGWRGWTGRKRLQFKIVGKSYAHMIALVVAIWGDIELFTFARPSNGHICKWVWLTAARSDNSYLISGCGSLLASRQQQLYRWISGC